MTHSHYYKELVHTIKLDLRILKDDLRYANDPKERGYRVKQFLEKLEERLDTNGKITNGKEITS